MQKLNCAICGPKQQISELYPATFNNKALYTVANARTFSARRTPDRIHYRFVKCHKCGLIFSNPILPAKDIAKLYKESDFYYSTEADYLKKTYGDLLNVILSRRRRISPLVGDKKDSHSRGILRSAQDDKVKLLDIGCGNGFFLEAAKNLGINSVYGVEPGIESVQKAPKWLQPRIKIAIFKPGLYPKNSFDIVTCFHTLDHIVDPKTFLNEVRKVLKPGGKALFVVHNTDGLSVKLFGQRSAIFDIEHIYLFNKETLSKIFSQQGFKVSEVVDLKNCYPLQYWLRMMPVPMKSLLLELLQSSGLGKLPVALKAGNIAIIASKNV